MKKIYLGVFAITLLLVMSSFVMAMPKKISSYEPGAKNTGKAGKSDIQHMYLVEKDAEWNIIDGGAWGKVRLGKEKSVFNGHGLEADMDYTLIRYDGEIWPDAECLGSSIADNKGNVHIMGIEGSYGDKIWLVLSSDVDCATGEMTAWNPSEYLFEYDLI